MKSLFGWSAEPEVSDLPAAISSRLERDDRLLQQVLELLKEQSVGTASQLVGNIQAKTAITGQNIHIGTFNG